jgi:hypothetical protein
MVKRLGNSTTDAHNLGLLYWTGRVLDDIRNLGFLQCYNRLWIQTRLLELVPDLLEKYPVEFLMMPVVYSSVFY